MRNRSKIAWKKLSEEKPDKKGTYLVAFFIDKKNKPNALSTALVEWHTVGDIVEMHNPALQKEDRSGVNGTKRKLMSYLGGSCVNYEVKEDGFYYIGINWDFTQDNKGEDGCIEYVENLGQNVFWADIPLMPEGYVTNEEWEEIDRTNWEDRKKKNREDKTEAMIQRFETDELLKQCFPLEHSFPDGISSSTQVEVSRYGVLYRMSSVEYASLLCSARDIMLIVKQMASKGESFESFSRMPVKQKQELLAEIVKEAGVNDINSVKQAGYYFDAYKNRDDIFFSKCRHCLKNKIGGGKENMPKVLAGAEAESSRAFCLYALERFLQLNEEMEVPEIIIVSKFQWFANAHSAAFMTDYVAGISNENEYARLFNVDPEGNYAEYHQEDLGEEYDGIVCVEDEPDETDEENDDEEEPVIGVDFPYYAVAMSPNHLMYDADFAIRDNSAKAYVFGEDGKELIFNEWEDAKKKRDELEAKATA